MIGGVACRGGFYVFDALLPNDLLTFDDAEKIDVITKLISLTLALFQEKYVILLMSCSI